MSTRLCVLLLLGSLIAVPTAQASAKCTGTGTAPTYSGVVFGSAGGVTLAADVFEPAGAGPFPAVVLIHGGSWRFGCRQDVWSEARAVAAAGMVGVAIDYRGTKQGFTAPADTDDAASAVAWLKANAAHYKVNGSRIGAMGFSSGGQIAAVLAGQRKITAMASISGDLDIKETCETRPSGGNCASRTAYLGCSLSACPSVWTSQDAVDLATSSSPPAFFSQGTNDGLVDYAEAVNFDNKLTSLHVTHEFCSIKSGKHAQATETLICPESHMTVLDSAIAFMAAHV